MHRIINNLYHLYIYKNVIVINILVIDRMTLLISYTNYYGAHVFFLPGAHSMLKPALLVIINECTTT